MTWENVWDRRTRPVTLQSVQVPQFGATNAPRPRCTNSVTTLNVPYHPINDSSMQRSLLDEMVNVLVQAQLQVRGAPPQETTTERTVN